jgi:transglutaminase-like putative cysteine protease
VRVPATRAAKGGDGQEDVRLVNLYGGDLGALATLARMRAMVNQSLADAAVRDAAQELVRMLPARDTFAQAQAIREFVAQGVQFVPDPRGVEVLTSPAKMLADIAARRSTQGDCDNAAVLSAALGKAIGLRAQFVVLGFFSPDAPYSHVYTRLQTAQGWLQMDTTKPAPSELVGVSISRRHYTEV